MSVHINKFGDGSKLMNTKYRPSFYKPQIGYGENLRCLSDKRIKQITHRMYKNYWT